MNLLNAIIVFGAFTAASAEEVTTESCDKIKPNFLIGAESDQGGRLYFKVTKAYEKDAVWYKNNANKEYYHDDIKRNEWKSSYAFDTPGAGAATEYWWPNWKNNKIGFTLYNKGNDKIIITKWNIVRCTKIHVFAAGACAKQSQITDMEMSNQDGICHGKDGSGHGSLLVGKRTLLTHPVSVSEIQLLPAETFEMNTKDKLDSISSECKSNEYSMTLNVFSDPNLHFVLAATSNTNDEEDNCPDDILLMSQHGEKTVLFPTTKEVAEITAKMNVVAHQLGNVTLGDIIEAERNAKPFVYETNYDLTQNSCFHYAQRITRYLQLDETVALGDFLVQNLLRNDALLKMAKKHTAKRGLRVMSKFVSKDMYEKYVKDLIFSQLNIAGEEIKTVPEATEDVSVVAA
eukprot:scaffold145304_cov62-Cyclotella_meneghiniana.AAC.6